MNGFKMKNDSQWQWIDLSSVIKGYYLINMVFTKGHQG